MKHYFSKLLSVILLSVMLLTSFAGCKGYNAETGSQLTPAAAPTDTAAPVTEPVLTPPGLPDITPDTALRNTPGSIPEITPVQTPVPGSVPTDTPVQTPVPSPVPTDTPVPTPTAAPTPVPVTQEKEPVQSLQMGDNIWYDNYDNSILVVRGTGATYSFEDYYDYVMYRQVLDSIPFTAVFIEEGVTEIGDYALGTMLFAEEIHIPSSLKKVGKEAFHSAGYAAKSLNEKTIRWIGLDLTRLDAAEDAFIYCAGLENVAQTEKFILVPTPTPTPTPTPIPTPSPTPNPDKPRLVETHKMGDNVTYEFWDNGYLYVKGTGETWDMPFGFDAFRDFNEDRTINYNGFHSSIKTIVVEEGITYLGTRAFHDIPAARVYLPKSLTKIGTDNYGQKEIHGYYNGKAFTMTGSSTDELWDTVCLEDVFFYLENSEKAEEHYVTIVWDE